MISYLEDNLNQKQTEIRINSEYQLSHLLYDLTIVLKKYFISELVF